MQNNSLQSLNLNIENFRNQRDRLKALRDQELSRLKDINDKISHLQLEEQQVLQNILGKEADLKEVEIMLRESHQTYEQLSSELSQINQILQQEALQIQEACSKF